MDAWLITMVIVRNVYPQLQYSTVHKTILTYSPFKEQDTNQTNMYHELAKHHGHQKPRQYQSGRDKTE
jgi:hypothetical protein